MTVRSDIGAPLSLRKSSKTGLFSLAGLVATRHNDAKGSFSVFTTHYTRSNAYAIRKDDA